MTAKVHQIEDITRNYHRENKNSEDANQFVSPGKVAMQEQIYRYITGRGKMGATCQEVERDLKMKHQTASARCSEMQKPNAKYRLYKNGIKRALPGSQKASAYVSSPGQLFLV